MEYNCLSLNQIADSITEKISIDDISTLNYISTENMIVNKAGVEEASKLPNTKKVNFYRKKDILVSNIRPYFKKIWQADNDGGASADVLIYRANQNYIDEEYLYYFLSQDSFFDFMVQTSKGTKMPRGDKNAIANYEVSFPKNIVYQRKVASIGRTIDEKIKLNKKTIANLKELSQTLFKRWFVDFEFPDEDGNPYHIHGGKMIQSELGEIPEGWSIGKIDQIGTITGGGTPSRKVAEYYTNKGISWITPKDLSIDKSTFIYKGQNDITELGLKKGSAKLLPEHAVLFSSRAPIGYIAIAGQQVTTNQGFKSIVPDKGFGPYYIYFLLKHKLPSIEQAASGSTFKEISGKGLKNIIILLPNENLVRHFNEIVKVYFDKIKNLELESLYLRELRDTLLPKLMSGEIELPDELEVDKHAELLQ